MMLCFVFAALVVLLDQFMKRWVLLTLALQEHKVLIPGILSLTNVRNTGAAFSILSNQRWLLTGIAFGTVLFLIAILLRYDEGFWGTLGLSAVLGGAVGNLIDRLFYGYVIDIFNPLFINFAIFNIADIFITLGGITFIVFFIHTTVKQDRDEPAPVAHAPAEYSQPEPAKVETQIGLYDFQYNEKIQQSSLQKDTGVNNDSNYSGSHSNTGYVVLGGYPGIEPYMSDEDLPPDIIAALTILSELEQELQAAGLFLDKDPVEILREYGFEEDTDYEF